MVLSSDSGEGTNKPPLTPYKLLYCYINPPSTSYPNRYPTYKKRTYARTYPEILNAQRVRVHYLLFLERYHSALGSTVHNELCAFRNILRGPKGISILAAGLPMRPLHQRPGQRSDRTCQHRWYRMRQPALRCHIHHPALHCRIHPALPVSTKRKPGPKRSRPRPHLKVSGRAGMFS